MHHYASRLVGGPSVVVERESELLSTGDTRIGIEVFDTHEGVVTALVELPRRRPIPDAVTAPQNAVTVASGSRPEHGSARACLSSHEGLTGPFEATLMGMQPVSGRGCRCETKIAPNSIACNLRLCAADSGPSLASYAWSQLLRSIA